MTEQGKTLAIAVLTVTAVLLLCTVLLVDRMPVQQAQAGSTPDRQGDYILITGGTIRGDEAVYVIDNGVRKMGVYAANASNNTIEVRASFDLAKLP